MFAHALVSSWQVLVSFMSERQPSLRSLRLCFSLEIFSLSKAPSKAPAIQQKVVLLKGSSGCVQLSPNIYQK